MDLERTFDAVYPSLFRYCHRLTGDGDAAEDVAQESFVRLFAKKVEGSEAGIRAWLFKTATHLVRDRYRVEENRKRLLQENPVTPAEMEGPDRSLERKDVARRARAALAELSARDREMLLMRYEGFSYKDIADVIGVAPGSVGTLLARAEKRFAKVVHAREELHDAS